MNAKLLGLATLSVALVTSSARADWLVMRDGARLETRGPWEVRAGQVVFTRANGTLSSLRLRDVDLEASRRLTEQPPTAEAAPEPETPAAEPVMVITDRDILRASSAATSGPEVLVERFSSALERRDMAALLRLVNLEGAIPEAERLVREQLQWALDHEVASIEIEPVGSGDVTEQTRQGITYRPNVDLKGKLVLRFQPDEELSTPEMSFLIGTRLGSYQIGVAAPVTAP